MSANRIIQVPVAAAQLRSKSPLQKKHQGEHFLSMMIHRLSDLGEGQAAGQSAGQSKNNKVTISEHTSSSGSGDSPSPIREGRDNSLDALLSELTASQSFQSLILDWMTADQAGQDADAVKGQWKLGKRDTETGSDAKSDAIADIKEKNLDKRMQQLLNAKKLLQTTTDEKTGGQQDPASIQQAKVTKGDPYLSKLQDALQNAIDTTASVANRTHQPLTEGVRSEDKAHLEPLPQTVLGNKLSGAQQERHELAKIREPFQPVSGKVINPPEFNQKNLQTSEPSILEEGMPTRGMQKESVNQLITESPVSESEHLISRRFRTIVSDDGKRFNGNMEQKPPVQSVTQQFSSESGSPVKSFDEMKKSSTANQTDSRHLIHPKKHGEIQAGSIAHQPRFNFVPKENNEGPYVPKSREQSTPAAEHKGLIDEQAPRPEQGYTARQMNKVELWLAFQGQKEPVLSQPSVQQQVTDQISGWLSKSAFLTGKKGEQTLTVNLYPEQLGHLSIVLTRNDQGIIARITAETQQAKDLLEQGISQLKRDLSGKGIGVTHIDISRQFQTWASQQILEQPQNQQPFQGHTGSGSSDHPDHRQDDEQPNKVSEDENQHSFSDWLTGGEKQ